MSWWECKIALTTPRALVQDIDGDGYLDTYQQKNGHFLPFMVSAAGGPFSTVPEDGRALVLRPGDRLLADKALFEFGQRGV